MSQIIFAILLIACIAFSFRVYRRIWNTIRLGIPGEEDRSSSLAWKRTILIAFGQKKMFKKWLPATLHAFIYLAFLLTQIELVEIILDGLVGQHRILSQSFSGLYSTTINLVEILSALALLATIVFLLRRTVLLIPRFRKPEMKGWPSLDGKLILLGELVLVFAIFTMNGSDYLLQDLRPVDYPKIQSILISPVFIAPIFSGFSADSLVLIERSAWWIHVLMVFGFICYLPYSKHLHIILAFPNVYFSSQRSSGQIDNIPVITREIKSMMGLGPENTDDEVPSFGAKDIFDLKRNTLLAAFACTECGRCTDSCPANQTGKTLSPRKIMMDIRDRCEEVSAKLEAGTTSMDFNDGKSLWDSISQEEIFACTSCQACVEACPIMINPLEPILEMRRYQILNEGKGPGDWLPMFTSIENSGSAWQVQSSRTEWINA